ncbi:hypothetical protein ACH6EH_07090 [Paenibacillus sp. JSM ZJ436]|uniref:hypothetical protein n=1 Tax=Paenibacillus sp. JSM ZJ436 TaxID=3376190 RepID=UPI0037B138D9
MSSNISVSYEIIMAGKQEEYIQLEIEHQQLKDKLWELGSTQKKWFGKMEGIVNKYGHKIAYDYEGFIAAHNYEDFRKLKAWKDIVILKSYVDEALEREGLIQELNIKYIDIREKIEEIYAQCGLEDLYFG